MNTNIKMNLKLKMSLLSFLLISSLVLSVKCESLSEIRYEKNSPIYNLIFSEKFPPSVPVGPSVIQQRQNHFPTQIQSEGFSRKVVDISSRSDIEKKEELSTMDNIIRGLSNLKLALYDCKLSFPI